jgi:dihydroxy-acid dehydratase
MASKKRGMRRGLTAYGDEDFSLFLRKAFIKAMGYTDDALERPIIGITNTYSGFNACHRTVPELIEAVKRGVMLAADYQSIFRPSRCTSLSRIRRACFCAI